MWKLTLWILLAVGMITGLPTGQAWSQAAGESDKAKTLKVMTFNVWSGEQSEAGVKKLIEIMKASKAEIIGVQEMNVEPGRKIAEALGYHYHQQSGGGIQVISRFPKVSATASKRGVKIKVGPDQHVWLFNAHLPAYPYQPYDLRDGKLPMNEAKVIEAAERTRGKHVSTYLQEIKPLLEAGETVFFLGDFNEPSHLDWTAAKAKATARPFDLKVMYPTSKRIVDAGFVDSIRAVRPDPVKDPADTWTPGAPPPRQSDDEVMDRIDIIYHAGERVKPLKAATMGIDSSNISTDIAVRGYNSDHRAVVVTFELSR